MIEIILFSGAGFLVATLIVLLALPVVTGKAAHKAALKMQQKMPYTAEEVAARTDQLRADYAVSLRKLEINLEKHQEQSSRQGLELSDIKKKLDASNKLSKASKLALEEIKAKEFDLNERLRKRDAQFAGLEQRSRQILRENRDLKLAVKRAERNLKPEKQKSMASGLPIADANLTQSTKNEALPKAELPGNLATPLSDQEPLLKSDETKILEEKLLSFAAQITSLTAQLEGEGSEIHKIISDEKSNENSNSLASRIQRLMDQQHNKEVEPLKEEPQLSKLPEASTPDLTPKATPKLKVTPVKRKTAKKETNIIKKVISKTSPKENVAKKENQQNDETA